MKQVYLKLCLRLDEIEFSWMLHILKPAYMFHAETLTKICGRICDVRD